MHRLVLPGFEDGQAVALLPHARPTPHGNIAYLTDKLVQHYLRILQNERPAAPCVRQLPSVNIRPVPGKPVRKQPQRPTARSSPVPVPLLIGVSLLRSSYFATKKLSTCGMMKEALCGLFALIMASVAKASSLFLPKAICGSPSNAGVNKLCAAILPPDTAKVMI